MFGVDLVIVMIGFFEDVCFFFEVRPLSCTGIAMLVVVGSVWMWMAGQLERSCPGQFHRRERARMLRAQMQT